MMRDLSAFKWAPEKQGFFDADGNEATKDEEIALRDIKRTEERNIVQNRLRSVHDCFAGMDNVRERQAALNWLRAFFNLD